MIYIPLLQKTERLERLTIVAKLSVLQVSGIPSSLYEKWPNTCAKSIKQRLNNAHVCYFQAFHVNFEQVKTRWVS